MLKSFLRGTDDESLLSAERVMLVAIAGILLALAVLQVAHMRGRNRDAERRADMYAIQLGVQKYFALHGVYPLKVSDVSDLGDANCADPVAGGNCQKPGYSYVAFARGTTPSPNLPSNCDNQKVMCAEYIIFSDRMETTVNPYSLSSS